MIRRLLQFPQIIEGSRLHFSFPGKNGCSEESSQNCAQQGTVRRGRGSGAQKHWEAGGKLLSPADPMVLCLVSLFCLECLVAVLK
ncbi:UNVERIFIED_CONTAM: hypothetical protein K2H54_046954 [Gekko kuhli]